MSELTSTIYMGGVFVGSVISGLISDRFVIDVCILSILAIQLGLKLIKK